MTRFKLIYLGNPYEFVLKDYSTNRTYGVFEGKLDNPMDEVVVLLNHLHQENQELKHYKLYEDNKRLQTIIADLKKDNEQLKKENKVSEEDVTDYHNALFDLHKEFEKLEKENERLRKRNKFLEEFDGRTETFANLKEENEQLTKEI